MKYDFSNAVNWCPCTLQVPGNRSEIDIPMRGFGSKVCWYDLSFSDKFSIFCRNCLRLLRLTVSHWLLVQIWFLSIDQQLSSQRVTLASWENRPIDFEITIPYAMRILKHCVYNVFLTRLFFIRMAEAPSWILNHADNRFSKIKTRFYSLILYNSIIYEVGYKPIACNKI